MGFVLCQIGGQHVELSQGVEQSNCAFPKQFWRCFAGRFSFTPVKSSLLGWPHPSQLRTRHPLVS